MRRYKLLFFILFLLVLPLGGGAIDLTPKSSKFWSIEGTDSTDRWIVIRNLSTAEGAGVFHIEILGRRYGAEPWDLRRVRSHMAISKEALERSVIAPLSKGAVYPEQFNEALQKWKKLNDGRGGDLCQTSIGECLKLEK